MGVDKEVGLTLARLKMVRIKVLRGRLSVVDYDKAVMDGIVDGDCLKMVTIVSLGVGILAR